MTGGGFSRIAIGVLGLSAGWGCGPDRMFPSRWDGGAANDVTGTATGGGRAGGGGAPVGGSGGTEPDAAAGAGGGLGGAAGTGMPPPGLGWRDLSPCIFPKPTPIFDFSPMLAFDRDRRKLVLYGGLSRSYAGLPPEIAPGVPAINQWELDADSGVWTDRTGCPPVGFAALNGAMVYDTRRRRLVIFTGGERKRRRVGPGHQPVDRPSVPVRRNAVPGGPPAGRGLRRGAGQGHRVHRERLPPRGPLRPGSGTPPGGGRSAPAPPISARFPSRTCPPSRTTAIAARCGCSGAAPTRGSIISGGGMSATRLPGSSMSRRRLALPRGPPNVSARVVLRPCAPAADPLRRGRG